MGKARHQIGEFILCFTLEIMLWFSQAVDMSDGQMYPGRTLARILHKSLPDLTYSLIPQEIFLQSPVIKDTGFLQEFPCETNELRDIKANLCNMRARRLKLRRDYRRSEKVYKCNGKSASLSGKSNRLNRLTTPAY